MKIKILSKKFRHLAAISVLGAGLGFLCIHLPMRAAAQTAFLAPCTFTTLTVKACPAHEAMTNAGMEFSNLKGLAVDAAGNIYVANTRKHIIYRITPTGGASLFAGQTDSPGSEDGPGSAARFRYPQSVAVDGAGNIYVADSGNDTIRRITPAGMVTTLAGLARQSGSIDGTGANARFSFPNGVAVDSTGNVYVADLYNATIRKVTPAGTVSTLAGLAGEYGKVNGKGSQARFSFPYSVAVNSADDVFVTDILNNSIRKVTATGVVTTFAGQMSYDVGSADGPGVAAQFCHPCGLAVDGLDNIYVVDQDNATIRKITPAGTVETFAGLAGQRGNADGTGSAARFDHPSGIALDHAGNVYVTELGNAAIRKGTPGNEAIASLTRPTGASFALTAPPSLIINVR